MIVEDPNLYIRDLGDRRSGADFDSVPSLRFGPAPNPGLGPVFEPGTRAAMGGAPAGADGASIILAWPRRLGAALLRWLERERERRVMHGLSDHLLDDMGLFRNDRDGDFRRRF